MSSSPNNLNNPEISARELTDRMQKGEKLNLLDVREVIEFSTYNIGGLNIPLQQILHKYQQLNINKTDELIVICQAGLRSETAQIALQQNGFQNVRNLTGGLLALRKLNS
jgi:rhodanese-related sulfurtransferase